MKRLFKMPCCRQCMMDEYDKQEGPFMNLYWAKINHFDKSSDKEKKMGLLCHWKSDTGLISLENNPDFCYFFMDTEHMSDEEMEKLHNLMHQVGHARKNGNRIVQEESVGRMVDFISRKCDAELMTEHLSRYCPYYTETLMSNYSRDKGDDDEKES